MLPGCYNLGVPERKRAKALTICLPAPEAKRLEAFAKSRSISIEEALQQVLNSLPREPQKSSNESFYALQGSLKDHGVFKFMREDKEIERQHDLRLSR